MNIELGATAPDFTADSTQGPIHFHEWMGNEWAVLFSHPKDYSAVCMTELGEVSRLKPEFDRRRTKPIGLSLNPVSDHLAWFKDIEETQSCGVNFPIIGDPERKVATLYGMIHVAAEPAATVRTLFIIDPNKKIRLFFVYPRMTGRNFNEVLRVLDSLQLTSKHQLATPANWKPGDDVIIPPSISDEDARKRFPAGWKAAKPYLRTISDPSVKNVAH